MKEQGTPAEVTGAPEARRRPAERLGGGDLDADLRDVRDLARRDLHVATLARQELARGDAQALSLREEPEPAAHRDVIAEVGDEGEREAPQRAEVARDAHLAVRDRDHVLRALQHLRLERRIRRRQERREGDDLGSHGDAPLLRSVGVRGGERARGIAREQLEEPLHGAW